MKSVNRRDFLKLSGTTLIGMTLGGVALKANAQEHISLDDPTANALKYTHSSTVEGSKCGNCLYIKGEKGAAWRPCQLFPNKLVNANGWCISWNKQPG